MLSLNAAAAMCRAQVVSADLNAGVRVFTRITTDSRDVRAGDLFVALSGERFDGHDFVADVMARGAVAAVVTRIGASATELLVNDTRVALGEIAAGWRRRFKLPVIAVTGSNGKTTVKEMIASILAAQAGEAGSLATRGNLNNEVGVPLTLLRLKSEHELAVIELGMNHPGEIAQLAALTQPTVALVNNAQREHQEFMSSVEAVALENGSVFTCLPADGVAVFPAGTSHDDSWRDLAGARKVVRFGIAWSAAEVRVESMREDSDAGQRIALHGAIETAPFTLAALGEHNRLNAAAAAACAHAAGVDTAAIVHGLEQFAAVKGRLQRKPVLHGALKGALVIDDTYNANPDSVRAAIDVLARYAERAVLVLGDMGEVGDQGQQFHAEVGAYAKQRGITRLLALGDATRNTVAAFGCGATHHTDVLEIADAVKSFGVKSFGANAVVLVKGSRFMRMERVVAALLEEPAMGKEHA